MLSCIFFLKQERFLLRFEAITYYNLVQKMNRIAEYSSDKVKEQDELNVEYYHQTL